MIVKGARTSKCGGEYTYVTSSPAGRAGEFYSEGIVDGRNKNIYQPGYKEKVGSEEKLIKYVI